MPQVSLYVDDAMMQSLRSSATREGVSLSKYVAQHLEESKAAIQSRSDTPSGMPKGYFERFFGCITDETFVRPEQPDFSLDARRISFD